MPAVEKHPASETQARSLSGGLLLIAVFGLLLAGLAALFQWRFAAGDIYPPYSSLRADPLGAKVLFESLRKFPSLKVERNYRPLDPALSFTNTTIVFAGLSHDESVPPQFLKQIEALSQKGNRIILTFLPLTAIHETNQPAPNRPNLNRPPGAPDPRQNRPNQPPAPQPEPNPPADLRKSLARHFGIEILLDPSVVPEKNIPLALTAERVTIGDSSLPLTLSWHSPFQLQFIHDDWQSVYERADKPVFAERILGSGSLVISTDSFFLSNEAMLKERQPALISWLLGHGGEIVFDETHFGIAERPGVASLARKYRLHGLLLSLIALALLFVWKNSTPLVPSYAELPAADQQLRSGKDALSGYVRLLQRNIPPADLLQIAFDQWKNAAAGRRLKHSSKLAQAESIAAIEQSKPHKERDPVRAYQNIRDLL